MENRRGQENDKEVQTAFRVDGGSDNHFLGSTIIPDIEQMVRDVKTLDPQMEIETLSSQQPVLGVKFGILQINTRQQDGRITPLAMTVIIAP